MTTKTKAKPTPETWACELCDRTFTRKQGLGRHMSETHGTPTTRESRAAAPAARSTRRPTALELIESEVQQMLAPLRKRRTKLDADIATKLDEVADLRKTRTYVDSMIRKLSPAQANPMPSSGGARANANAAKIGKRDALREYLHEHAQELVEGFTGNSLHAQLQREDFEPRMSPPVVNELLAELRDLGVVRAERVSRGGGIQYLVVQTTNGKQRGTDGTSPQT